MPSLCDPRSMDSERPAADREPAGDGPQAAPRLLRTPPDPLPVGGGTALFAEGLLGELKGGSGLRLLVNGKPVELMGAGVPPPRSRRGDDYWWAVVPIGAVEGEERLELELAGRPPGGEELVAPLSSTSLIPASPPPAERERAQELLAGGGSGEPGEPSVAICMATYEPDIAMFARQIDSIRAQTHRRWVCLISDDGSAAETVAAMREVLGDDDRFLLAPGERNLGFYANFERALGMVPAAAELVALSDQDDEWHPGKLEALIDGLEPDALLVYSDMRIVDRSGTVISDTYWSFRDNNHTDFASLVLANTVTGAASLFRRELLADVLPFPPRHANAFHDHWIAQVAMALGPISYVDRPLYDYVQHDEAAIGYLSANGGGRYSGSLLSRARISAQRLRRRRYHLGWRVPYFKVYCRIVLAATALELRLAGRLDPEKAEVLATLREPSRAARWLARRIAHDGLKTTETLGRERVMLAGLAWHGVERARRRVGARR